MNIVVSFNSIKVYWCVYWIKQPLTINKREIIMFKLIEDTATLKSTIASISTDGKTLQDKIHQAAVSCLYHIDKHGDITLALKLVESLINSMPMQSSKREDTRKAITEWFTSFGKLKETSTMILGKKVVRLAYDKTKVTSLEQAIETPFWNFAPAKEEKPKAAFDLTKCIENIIKRAEKAQLAGENVNTDELAALKKLVQTTPAF